MTATAAPARAGHPQAAVAEPMLAVSDLHAYYGKSHILQGVDLTVRDGEIVSLLGRNGVGRSTTIKTIMGQVPPQGSVRFKGREIAGLKPHEIAHLGLGYVPEERRIFTDLSVDENLEVGRQAPRADRPAWTPERLFAIFPNLAEMRGRRASQMSGGEQQMLTIARTLMGNPIAVLLDEPSEGLAPVIVEQLAEAVLAMKGEGIAVLLSEQNLTFASAVSDRAYVIERGQIRYQGTVGELSHNEAVRDAYLSV